MKGTSVYVRERKGEGGSTGTKRKEKRVIVDKTPMYYFLAKYTRSKSQSYTGSIYKLLKLWKRNLLCLVIGKNVIEFLDLDFHTSLHQANKFII